MPTFRNLLDLLEAEWATYARALTHTERERFAKLWQRARRHASASSYQSPADPFHAVFLSILLEHEAELERLRARLDALPHPHERSVDPRPPT